MKKLLIGCMAAVAALIAFSGCDQDKVAYNGPSYLMFEGKHYKILSNTVTIKAGEMSTDVKVQGLYKNIGITDSLGFALRLVIPDTEQWSLQR